MIILASSSPRRRELLANAGILFRVQTGYVPEVHQPGESPVDFASRLAREKAEAVARKESGNYVLGADTIVIVAGEILGKPKDGSDAARMLRLLSGREHDVTTAICIIAPDGTPHGAVETTRVFFHSLSAAEIADYIAHGEPMDKAGAYAIQGLASKWIYRIEGDYFTVMGLPVAKVWELLRRMGYALDRAVND
jgi:septum formation protein